MAPSGSADSGSPAPRELILMRHAQAADDGTSDARRSLTDYGRLQASAQGRALAGMRMLPDAVLVSTALRTQQTWERVRGGAGLALQPIMSEELYRAWVSEVLDLVRATTEGVRRLLVIGHETTMSATTAQLAALGSNEEALRRAHHGFPTATFAVLRVSEEWSELTSHSCILSAVVVPEV